MKAADLHFVFTTLKKKYPAKTELIYATPFQLLVAVMLSAQTTDKQVNKVTARFFTTIKIPQDLVSLWLPSFTKLISSINYYKTKAKHIYTASRILASTWWILPTTVKSLMLLPGVGEKTAKVVTHVLYWEQVIPVDTHVHRIANRLWWVTTTTPLQTSKLLEKVIPNKYKEYAHHVLVLFWRYFCTARNPQCDQCAFTRFCCYYKNI